MLTLAATTSTLTQIVALRSHRLSRYSVASGVGRTLLPDGMKPPAHWHIAGEADDPKQALQSFGEAWGAWRRGEVKVAPPPRGGPKLPLS
ncbi:MAG TPA: hypothetical protein VEW25_03500, partial [Allosphingosinicella sp.]|nr:hypothetical protein [Allosphingosinicella sp.]